MSQVSRTEVEGWLLDAYPSGDGEMVAWVKRDDGAAVRLTDNWRNAIYVSSSPEGLDQLAGWAGHQYQVFSCEYVNRRVNVFEYGKRPVLKLTLRNADHAEKLARELEALDVKFPLSIFNADLMPAQTYFFEKELFPLAKVSAEQDGASIRWRLLDSVMSEDYRIPELRKAWIEVRVAAQGRIPKFSDPIEGITVKSGEGATEIGEGDERVKILSFVDVIRQLDPDIIFFERGDEFTTHYLAERAWVNGISDKLVLSRDPKPLRRLTKRGTSYMAYGRVMHTPASHKLYGRINLDAENYFVFSECGLDGLFEIARLCRMPIHKGSRASIGKCLSSLQAYVAFKDDLLIPWKPRRAEIPKTARTLLVGDRGGFIYEPKVGLHENVGEIDFTCLTGNSTVETLEGKKRLSQVTEHDQVFTPFGWQKIVSVHRYHIKSQVVKLTLEDGRTLTSTPHHKFPALIRWSLKERTAREMRKGTTLIVTDFDPQLERNNIAVLFGVYAAEGSHVHRDFYDYDRSRNRVKPFHQYRIDFNISRQEEDLKEFITSTLRKIYPSVHVYTRSKKGTNGITLSVARKGVVNDFISRYDHFIHNPNSSAADKSSFLCGFFEGDGGVNIRRNTVQCNQSTVNSKKLALVLKFLRDLGVNYNIKTYHFKGTFSPNPANYVELSGLDSVVKYYTWVGFISGQKQERLRNAVQTRIRKAKNANHPRLGLYVNATTKSSLSFIRKMRVMDKEIQDYEGDVFDLTVEWNEFPFYFANGILTHNSLYPFIITKFNISAETVLCWCCPDSKTIVPDVGFHTCEKRRGIIPTSLEPILRKRIDYKRMKKDVGSNEALRRVYSSRVDALKGILVCCLTGDTPVLIRKSGEIRHVKIGEFIDDVVGRSEGVIDCPPEIFVSGLDRNLHARFCKIRKLIKLPRRNKILGITLETGRKIAVTEDHPVFILNNGQLETRKAEKIRKGDLVPVAKRLPPTTAQVRSIDLIDWLQRNLDDSEQLRWKVSGPVLREAIATNRILLTELATKAGYTTQAVAHWKKIGSVPLRIFSALNIPSTSRGDLHVGIGRRNRKAGGRTSWLPSIIRVNEDLGFFLGLFVSDGSATNTYIRLDIATSQDDLLENARQVVRSLFGISPRVYKEKKAEMDVLQINSLALVNFVERILDLPGTAERGKLKVPSLILNSNESTAQGFLEGMIAGDGTVEKDRNLLSIGIADPGFANQLGYLAAILNLGFRVDLHSREPARPLYYVNFVGPDTLSRIARWRFLTKGHLSVLRPKLEGLCEADCAHPIYKTVPVNESRLLELAVATRTVKKSRLRQRLSVCPERAQKAIMRIDAKGFDEGLDQARQNLQRLVEGDVGFLRVREANELNRGDEFVYCFQIDDEYLPGFFAGEGAVYTHNCFGYLSYRNAKFGLIDCHIAVCAYARQILLETARIAEMRGFEVVHGIVDSLWLKKPGATEEDFEDLRREIQDAIGLPLAFDGIYRWVAFLPSRMHQDVPVLNRYFGVFVDGSMKVRGIELRRRDAIKVVTDCQSDILRLLGQGKTLEEVRRLIPDAIKTVRRYANKIRNRGVSLDDLVTLNSLSKNHDQYNSNLAHVSAIRQLAEEGLELLAGQSVSYVITDYKAKSQKERVRPVELLDSDTKYDADRYVELLFRGALAILQPFGVDEWVLRDAVTGPGDHQSRLTPKPSTLPVQSDSGRNMQ